eukprot:7141260-Karenia_brevis.AAC.1
MQDGEAEKQRILALGRPPGPLVAGPAGGGAPPDPAAADPGLLAPGDPVPGGGLAALAAAVGAGGLG